MSFNSLYEHFAAQNVLPLKVDEVRIYLLEKFIQDEIRFIPSSLDEDVIFGFIEQYTESKPYDTNPVRKTDIYYSNGMSFEMQRLVICKELMHIFDASDAKVDTGDKLEQLLIELVNPPAPEDSSKSRQEEAKAIYRALSLFCSLPLREKLKAQLIKEELTIQKIGFMLRLPEAYAEYIISDRFPPIVEKILSA